LAFGAASEICSYSYPSLDQKVLPGFMNGI
jgi:hypothetical protein